LPVCADFVAGVANVPPSQSLELALNADQSLSFDIQDVKASKDQ
jgi:hypothetical protein